MSPRHLALALSLAAAVLALSSCARSRAKDPQWAPFIESARGAVCADVKNRLFLIDGSMVLWDRAGHCPDNGHAQTLYGRTPEERLCSASDSIAGPIQRCDAPEYAALFETMLANLDDPALGLGSEHQVERLPL